MVSATATRSDEPAQTRQRRRSSRLRRWLHFSLAQQMLAVNLFAVALLGGGMFYLDRYERGLIDTELQALTTQGGIIAAALAEGAVLQDPGEAPELVPTLAQGMMRSLVEPARIRARLFQIDGPLMADSRGLEGPTGTIQIQPLPPLDDAGPSFFDRIVDSASGMLRRRGHYPPYAEHPREIATDYPEVVRALDGRAGEAVRSSGDSNGLILSVAVPVRRYKQVLGAVLVSTGSVDLDRQVNSVRTDILRLSLIGLVVTILLSLYLAGTIARPVRKLARAAQAVRQGNGRKVEIPDFSRRHDEIGELSIALTDMTGALWRRMDAIERFAADVAHELKNPLSSLRSAVETVARIEDPVKQRRLMAIIHDDVERLDRLISDISDASRLDAEMSRLERGPVALGPMLGTLADVHEQTRAAGGPAIEVVRDPGDALSVLGKEGRLVQVLQNLLHNAISFSPPGGRITLRAGRDGDDILITIEDQGPGIPEGKLEAIFDRFYTERPAGEKFGTHSGLGLSISKQIVEAHGGTVTAENRYDAGGQVTGARFVVRLPSVRE
ncbi:MAG TPA: stimulus-sensing domain-containing protein [Aliidongia sp.]|nr:stimulus-sensing domain-containing protein [Aliidongia sp.]